MFTLVSSVASALHLLRGTPNDLNLVDNYIHDAGPLEVEQSHAVYVNASKAIVVSQYEEDIGWLQELQSKVNDSMLTVSIYQSKDDSKPGFVKNVGNEAYKYLRYIVDNYDDLPEYVMFVQASAQDWHDPQPKLDIIQNWDWTSPCKAADTGMPGEGRAYFDLANANFCLVLVRDPVSADSAVHH
mmetsp:Transcript_25870/g.66751  ORF Transcript_25870/g.66751 Transcript_25870/m.66751 type:complete len:185 (-) Transcript_25870:494-1048(-)